jgi:hypothetical protein
MRRETAGRCLDRAIPAEPGPAFDARFSRAEMSEGSSQEEGPTEKDESQKLQARTLDGNTAQHCEHVFVTDEFCAADASTPVRREHFENSMHLKSQADNGEGW